MLIIRNSQIAALRNEYHRETALAVTRDLHAQFPEQFGGLNDTKLTEHVLAAFGKAESKGLRTLHDLVLYARLEAMLNWDWEQHPELAWLTQMLEDPSYSNPSRRLQAAIAELQRRQGVHAANRILRQVHEEET